MLTTQGRIYLATGSFQPDTYIDYKMYLSINELTLYKLSFKVIGRKKNCFLKYMSIDCIVGIETVNSKRKNNLNNISANILMVLLDRTFRYRFLPNVRF